MLASPSRHTPMYTSSLPSGDQAPRYAHRDAGELPHASRVDARHEDLKPFRRAAAPVGRSAQGVEPNRSIRRGGSSRPQIEPPVVVAEELVRGPGQWEVLLPDLLEPEVPAARVGRGVATEGNACNTSQRLRGAARSSTAPTAEVAIPRPWYCATATPATPPAAAMGHVLALKGTAPTPAAL
jgi:hypothetical protein